MNTGNNLHHIIIFMLYFKICVNVECNNKNNSVNFKEIWAKINDTIQLNCSLSTISDHVSIKINN